MGASPDSWKSTIVVIIVGIGIGVVLCRAYSAEIQVGRTVFSRVQASPSPWADYSRSFRAACYRTFGPDWMLLPAAAWIQSSIVNRKGYCRVSSGS